MFTFKFKRGRLLANELAVVDEAVATYKVPRNDATYILHGMMAEWVRDCPEDNLTDDQLIEMLPTPKEIWDEYCLLHQ